MAEVRGIISYIGIGKPGYKSFEMGRKLNLGAGATSIALRRSASVLRERPGLRAKILGKLVPDILVSFSGIFLKPDREYEWEEPAWFIKAGLILVGLPTFGFVPRLYYRKFFSRQGNIEVWPYKRKADLEADLDKQPYLNSNENR